MPVSRATAERLARVVADQFAEAQTRMLQLIARRIGTDIGRPYWAEKKAAQMRDCEVQIRALIADLQRQAETGVRTALTDAYERGGLAAVADMKRAGMAGVTTPDHFAGINAVEQYTRATMGPLAATQQRTLITTMNAYRNAVTAGSAAASRAEAVYGGVLQVLTGTGTRVQATQQVLNDFARRGVTGFVDRAGRSWSLDSYAEMAVRAGTMNAALGGHLDTLQANGLDLVIVSDDGAPCPECADWEGQVLSIGSGTGEYSSVDDATAAGLFHPGCRHDLSLYQEGFTPPYPEKSEEQLASEVQGYKDSQKLRYYERKIRQSKRMQAVAVYPQAKQQASARVAAYQAKARAHVATTDAVRQYSRESITHAH